MKLFYHPSFTNNAFVDFEKSPIFLDAKIVNTNDLCNIIKLHAGIESKVKSYGERFVEYYVAMKKFMEKNPKNILAESFKVDKLNTTKKCLEWRDILAAARWKKSTKAPSERMKVLSGVEEYFNCISFGEEIFEIINQIENGCRLPEIEIITSPYYESFHPAEVGLIKALENRGIKICIEENELLENNISKIFSFLNGEENIELNKKDTSFEIWNFEERDEAIKYLSFSESKDFDVWINAGNKEFDNWQKLEGKKLSGSEIVGVPQITELLNIGLTIFERPLNLYNIVEWLNTTLNPLPQTFRNHLAELICSTGGYYNDTCKNKITSYIEKYPETQKLIKQFLPDINTPYFEESEIEVSLIIEFVKNLESWCRKKISQNYDCNPQIEQLGFVVNQANQILLLLYELETKTIPYSDIELMSSVFSKNISIMQYSAQANCKNIITSYSDFCDYSSKTVWCDFYENGSIGKLTYSFLSPTELEEFNNDLSLWDSKNERKYIRNLLLTPFRKTKNKLVLVTLDKIDSDPAPKSSLFIQLEKYFADKKEPENFTKNKLYPFVKQKKLNEKLFSSVDKIQNRMEWDQQFIQIENTDYIKDNLSEVYSYSSLESLIKHPLDYAIQKLIGFSGIDINSISDMNTTFGLVAHEIIQTLFSPNEKDLQSGYPDYIRTQMENNFEDIFEKIIQSTGAILLIKNNKLELHKFKNQLKESLNNLLIGMEANDLHVLECEKDIGCKFEDGKIIKHGYVGDLDIVGKVDMILEDSKNNLYIFDFKWSTSSNNEKKLEENKSIQLCLYKKLIEQETGKKVKIVAYYLLPLSKFVSVQVLNGDINFSQVFVNGERASKDLLKEIQCSYKYRIKELTDGLLEETTDFEEQDIEYEQVRDELGLLPMDYYKGLKSGPYEDIGLIKERKAEE